MSQRKGTDGTIQCTRVHIHISPMPFDQPRNPLENNQDHTYTCSIIKNTTRAFQNLGNMCFHEFHGPQIKSLPSNRPSNNPPPSDHPQAAAGAHPRAPPSYPSDTSTSNNPQRDLHGPHTKETECLLAVSGCHDPGCDVIDGDADTLVVPCVG
ncbi:hypothetical protein SLA2020_236450 [Shorea laevis]